MWKIIATIVICIILVTSISAYLYYTNILKAATPQVEEKAIAIIRIEGAILSPEVADIYTRAIDQAIRNDTIKAVVLVINSPGGEVTLIEQIYSDLLELKKKKPLISSVVSALSGGYYIAVASDYIYVLPSSNVGNIGIIAQEPPIEPPSEKILETGAYKLSGSSKLSFLNTVNRILNNFISAVRDSRGERLKLSLTELKRARIYVGVEAVSNGLADEIGSMQKAVEKAAQEAGIIKYKLVDLIETTSRTSTSVRALNNTYLRWKDLTLETLSKINPPPAIYYLYIPPTNIISNMTSRELHTAEESEAISIASEGERTVLIDASHRNEISRSKLELFIWELVKRNITVKFIDQWSELRAELNDSIALIVALPTISYSSEELSDIKRFVDKGGILLLLFDPAVEYPRTSAPLEAINSIANTFKLSFASGYLYNEEQYYGIYRNIYVSKFADNPLTQNLDSIILFTATHIRSDNQGIAWTSENTYSSQSEKAGEYSVIVSTKNNGTVIAIGDITFLTEPYCYLQDNYELLLNIVNYIAS